MSFSEFAGYSKEFDDLSPSIKSNLCSIAFVNRDSVMSVCAGTKEKSVFVQLCSGFRLPEEVFESDVVKWGVDLESIPTDSIRVYCGFSKRSPIRIKGYYLDKSGAILEKKVYKSNLPNGLLIDRYDAMGNLISENELEIQCTESEWNGPKKLVQIAKINEYEHNFMKKQSKNQTYLIVHQKYAHTE